MTLFLVDKRPVTLLEVLISIVLTIIVLTTLTFFYRQVSFIGAEVDKVNADNFRLRYVETRLADILPKVVAENTVNKDFVFFSIDDDHLNKPESQSLIFTFENGVSLDKEISNHALGRLYVDKGDNLMLAYWPSPKRWENGVLPHLKKEVLLENVKTIRFEFFIPPDKSAKKDLPEQLQKNNGGKSKEVVEGKPIPSPTGDWSRQVWLKEYETLPAIVKVFIDLKEGKTMEFAFPLANVKEHVIYE